MSEYVEHIPFPKLNQRMLAHSQWAIENVIYPILSILGNAHNQGIIHADVKPPNILVTPDGMDPDDPKLQNGVLTPDGHRVFLTDFGIAAVRKGEIQSLRFKEI